MRYDAIILGGGAAGLYCAIEAGKRGRRVLVIERNAQPGRKILISGGGRCNFTNLSVSAENFVSKNPHFAKSALSRHTPQDFISLVRRHGVEHYEKKLGQLFCRGSSRQIAEMLLTECRQAHVRMLTSCSIKSVDKAADFEVETDQGIFRGVTLVVATGGLSFPKVGATDLGYRIASHFGIGIVQTRPSLAPLVLAGQSHRGLAGISVYSDVSSGRAAFRENVLFTHRGLSGPAILQISNYWDARTNVYIDLAPDQNFEIRLRDPRNASRKLKNMVSEVIPGKAAEQLLGKLGEKRIGSLGESETRKAIAAIHRWCVQFSATEGYDKAEVTLGGVSTDELSSRTMVSRKVPGLYFIGEVVDVTGWLGGYNFQWAWSSGYAAALDI